MRKWLIFLLALTPSLPIATSQQAPSGSIDFMIWGEPAEKEAYDELVAGFSKKAPQIKVNIVYVPSQTSFRNRLTADLAAGTPPDVFLYNYRRYAVFAARDTVEPLDAYVAQSKSLKLGEFYRETLDPYFFKKKLYGIPQNLSSLVVYYNTDLFDKANLPYPKNDWTWDDFVRTAKALTKDTNGDGIPEQYGLGTDAVVFRMAPFIWQNGGDLVDNPEEPTRLTLNAPATRAALEWFMEFQTKHKVVPHRVQEQARNSESRFMDGTLAMYLNSRRGVPTYRDIKTFGWDVAPLPRGKERVGLLHSDAFFMASGSNNKPAAWAFIEYASSVEGQTILARSGRTVPSLKSVAQSSAFLNPNEKPKSNRVFLDVIPYIRAVPLMQTWAEIEALVSEDIERAYHGDTTLERAIQTATERTRRLFARP
jgi:multiple sugar transport system substrate-binding protein